MKILATLSLSCCLLFLNTALLAQKVQKYPLSEFTDINATTALKINLIQSDHYAIELPLEANADAFSLDGKTLKIKGNNKAFPAKSRREVSIYFVNLKNIELSGAVKLVSDSMIHVEDLYISLSGASSLDLSLTATALFVDVAGASKICLKGSAEKLGIDCSGSSLVQASKFVATTSEVDLSGASKITLNTSSITGDISGASIVVLNDEANMSGLDISGGAKIIRQKSGEVEQSSTSFTEENSIVVGDILAFTSPSISYKYKKKRPHFKAHWSGFEFGFAGYGDGFFSSRLPAGEENMELALNKSAVVNWNIVDFSLPICNGFGIATGVGIGWNIYKFLDKSIIPGKLDGKFVAAPYSGNEQRDYSKSKLQSSWMRVPIMIEYQTRSYPYHKTFYVSAGLVGGVRLGGSSKQFYTSDFDGRRKVKSKDDFYLSPFRADVEVRFGLGPIRLFATYGFSDLFLPNRGPKLNTYSFGICLFTY